MLAQQRKVVEQFSVELKNDVIPCDTLPYLRCLTDDDRESVERKQDREGSRAAVPVLLDRLKKRPNSFEQLLQALEYTGCQHLMKLLKDSWLSRQGPTIRVPQAEQVVTSPTEESTNCFQSELCSPSQETCVSQYDMLVCYGPKDKDIAFEIRKLMMEKYKLRVCIDEVDFIPGNAISANICDFIQCSNAIVFLLTPEFLEKKWAAWEMQRALIDVLEKRKQKKIIPVLLKECDIPAELEPYTPLKFLESDDANKMDNWARLAAAVQDNRGWDSGENSSSDLQITEPTS